MVRKRSKWIKSHEIDKVLRYSCSNLLTHVILMFLTDLKISQDFAHIVFFFLKNWEVILSHGIGLEFQMIRRDKCVQEEGPSSQEGYFCKQEVYSLTRFNLACLVFKWKYVIKKNIITNSWYGVANKHTMENSYYSCVSTLFLEWQCPSHQGGFSCCTSTLEN